MRVTFSMAHGLMVLLVALASSSLAADEATKPKTVSLQVEGTGPFPFAADGSKTTVWLPVKLPDAVCAADLTLTRQSVRFERRPDADVTKRFTVAPKLVDAERQTPTLAIEVSEIERLRPGQYDLVISATSKSKVTVAPLTIALERPAAQLTPPGKQTIDVAVDWPWSTSAEGTAAPAALRLLLSDDGRDSAVRSVTVSDGPFTSSDGNVRAKLGAKAASAAATQYVSLDLHPEGFPVGTSQGKLEIHSPDLKSASVVEVEVRTRLAKCWIALTVAAGLILGFLLRVELQRRLDLTKAKEQGLGGLDEFDRQRNGVLDQTFSRAVAIEFAKLERAVLSEDPQIIATELAATQAAVKQAVEDLNQRLAQAVTLLDDLRTQVPGAGSLPVAMQAVVDALATVAAAGAEKLKGRDAKGIQDDVRAALISCAKTLRLESARSISILAWANATYRDALSLLDPDLADERGPQLKTAFESVPDALTAPASLSTVQEIAALLDQWRTYGGQRLVAVTTLCAYLDADSQTLDELITNAANKSSTLGAARQQFRDAVRRVCEAMSRDVAASEAFALPSWTPRPIYAALLDLVALIKRERPDVKDAALDAFEAAVDAKDFFGAMRKLPPPAPGLVALSKGKAAPGAGGPSAGGAVFASPGNLTHAAGTLLPSLERLSDPRTLQAYAARNRRQLLWGNAIQTLAVGTILTVASLAFFRERFIGTAMELVGLFFWGFTADLSISKLTEVARGWAAKPK